MPRPTIEELATDPVVGPIVRRYLQGKMQALEAHRDLLNGTINHVIALSILDDIEANAIQGLRAAFPEQPALPSASDEIPARTA